MKQLLTLTLTLTLIAGALFLAQPARAQQQDNKKDNMSMQKMEMMQNMKGDSAMSGMQGMMGGDMSGMCMKMCMNMMNNKKDGIDMDKKNMPLDKNKDNKKQR